MQTSFSYKTSRFLVQLAVFLIPFYFFRFSIGPLRTNIFEVVVLAAALSSIFYLLSTKAKPCFGSVWPYLFLLISFVSIFLSTNKTSALGIFKGWFLTPIVMYLLILNLYSRNDLPKLVRPLFTAFSIVSLWGLLQSFGLITTLFYQKGDVSFLQYLTADNFRIFGPFESPNFMAMFLVSVFFLVLPVLDSARKISSKLYFFTVVPFGIAIYDLFMTGSRAGIIAFIFSFILLVLLKIKAEIDIKSENRWLTAISLAVVVLMFFLVLTRVSTDRSESNNARLQIYHYSFEVGKTNPVFGIGLGSFQTKIADISKSDIDFQVKILSSALHPHNIYLAMWLNLGILGLVVFLIIIGRFFHQLWLKINTTAAIYLMAAMVAILIHGLFDTTYFKNDLSAIFWLILAFSEIIHLSDNAKN